MADKKQTDWEKVGALTALGIAASEVASRIWGAIFRATLSEEIVNASLTPLVVGIVYFLSASSGRWKFGSGKGQFVAHKWIRILWIAGCISIVAALTGAWEAIQKRVEKLDYFEIETVPQGICATEGPKTRALKVRLVMPTLSSARVVAVCPSSIEEQVLTVADSTAELDELGPLPADLRCQQVVLRTGSKQEMSFLSCLGSTYDQAEKGLVELSVISDDGHAHRISTKGELKWYERLGL